MTRTDERLVGAANIKKKILEKLGRDINTTNAQVRLYLAGLREWILNLDERDATKAGGLKAKR